jgi:hypothetical protein
MRSRRRDALPIAPTLQDLEHAGPALDSKLAGHQRAEGVVVDADGITVLCSANAGAEGERTWLIRLTDDGDVSWERQYAPSQGTGRAIANIPGGGFVIAGDVQRSQTEYQAYLLRVDAAGGILYEESFGPRGVTGFTTVTVLDDGSTLAGGTARWKGWLVQMDSTWQTASEILVQDVDDVCGVVPLDNGGFAMAARMDVSTTDLGRTLLATFGRERQVQWEVRLPHQGRAEPAAIIAVRDGNIVAAGHHSNSEHDAAALWVVRLNAKGHVEWERQVGSAAEERRGRAIAPLANDIAVAGDARRGQNWIACVARLGFNGEFLWERFYGAEGRQILTRGMAATGNGGLVLVGGTTTSHPSKTNVWILRVDADGCQMWERIFAA